MEDTDVPSIFDHWVVYDLPATVTSLESKAAAEGELAGGKQGKSSRGTAMYLGPCPPPGASPHHYRFRIYALDAVLGLLVGAAKADVLAATQGHVVAQGELTGLFSR
jgi:Raf kinase inhibitor-like YbhB/YbcL family protein